MRKLIGDKAFYKMVIAVVLPIMIQNGITNLVSLLDNVMVGVVGSEQTAGVSIVNQLLFVFNLCIFGGVSGAGIFTAQFYGQKNYEGVRDTFRFKWIISSIITVVSVIVLIIFKSSLIESYLHEDGSENDIVATFTYATSYLKIMLSGLFPFMISQVYSSTLRETGETVVPMISSVVAVLVNLCINYMLIFGKLGFPELGIEGAAIGTVISRYIECFIVVVWTHKYQTKYKFIKGAYKNFKVPTNLAKRIIVKGTPLLINEALWASGMAVLMKCYSERGTSVVTALAISSAISNMFNIAFISLGGTVGIVVGPLLGAGKMEEAKDTAYKTITFSVIICLVMGIFMSVIAPFFPTIYNTSKEVKDLATGFIYICALCMPIHGFLNSSYFTIRSGGKTLITFLFDSVYLWIVCVPLAYLLSNYTKMPILTLYLLCQLIDLIKCIVGYILLKKEVWLENIVES